MKPPHGIPSNLSPQSFTQVPGGLAGRRPEPVAARVVGVPAPKRTHQTDARVTVRLPNVVELNRQALQALGVSAAGKFNEASPIDIIPPRRGASTQWLLDTRPEATGRVFEKKGTWYFKTAVRLVAAYFRQVGGPPRSRRQFMLGPEQQRQVCVTTPDGRQVCESQGTGVFALVPL